MSKTEIFVSNKCPHCQRVFKDQDANPDKYEGIEIINISESLQNLKRLLKYRDNLDGYKEVREESRIGIPSRVIDGEKVDFLEELKKEDKKQRAGSYATGPFYGIYWDFSRIYLTNSSGESTCSSTCSPFRYLIAVSIASLPISFGF